MCDTLVALGNSTKDGSVIFAKNSDRQPNEPHIIIRIPKKKHQKGVKVKCTYIEIDQVEETYEVLLLKPSWIWGCEMGCNEFGLTIGNEAVFTKEKYENKGLIGMDLVRLALERCKTSDEALETIIRLLEKYGQGGNCGYQKKFTYHNSFLIADRKTAWVLETAGRYWAAEKVKDIRSISNCLTIGKNFDRCHPELINHAIEMGWCKNKDDFNFAKCYSNQLFTKLSGAPERYKVTSNALEKEKGQITFDTVEKILRHHEDKMKGKQFRRHSLKSVCMHGGFIYGDHTTGSYIAVLSEKLDTHWVTGSSTPCISVFKPIWLIKEENFTFNEDEIDLAIKYWRKREKLHRMVLENRVTDLNFYLRERDNLEKKYLKLVNDLDLETINYDKLMKLMKYAWEKEEELVVNTINTNEKNKGKIKGRLYYKYYWHKLNKKLFLS